MAAEIQFIDATGQTDYVILTNSVGQWYNTVGAAFEEFNPSNFTDYDIAATEDGTCGFYKANMPAVAAGFYNLHTRKRVGGAPAQSDPATNVGSIWWDGTNVIFVGSLAQIADKFLGRAIAGGADGGRTVSQAFAAARNKVAFDVPIAGQFTVYAADDTTPLWTGTYTRAAVDTLVGIDPA